MAPAYTLATYKVIPGKEDEFISAWNGLAKAFSSLPSPPYWGTLIRSKTDRSVFHSFGPWEKADDVRAMRASSVAAEAFDAIRRLCVEMTPGDYELVTHIAVREEPVPATSNPRRSEPD